MPYYRAELGGSPPYEEGQGLDLTDGTLSLNAASTSEYGGAKVDGKTIGINSQGQLFALQEQTITLSGTTSSVAVGGTDTITATASAGGTISVTSDDTDIATVNVSNGEITITGVSAGNATITVTASSVGQYGSAEAVISVEVIVVHIYGAEWDGSSSPAWTRTDNAASFTDPNPYYSGMSGTPSSPFDDIMPWSGMRIVEDDDAGTLVEIPKFWYKWTRNGSAMKLQISDSAVEGFYVSPAHADRDDGVGERDYVYIGRYHCADDYKSKTVVVPKASTTRASFRTNIHNLGSNVWQNDYAMRWTVNMLYLVEFAHWNSQAKIGWGCGNDSSPGNMGYTDNMPYHTGTTQSRKTTYGLGTQYRYIEGWWDNVYDWVDGIYFLSENIYGIKNPASFSDSSGGTAIGTRSNETGYIKAWTTPSVSGFEYAIYPNSVDSNLYYDTYICDYCDYHYAGVALSAGGAYGQYPMAGAFLLYGSGFATDKVARIGSRLMVLPSSRLSPPTP